MTLANVSQAVFPAKWTTVFWVVLAGGAIVTCLWLLRTVAHSNATHRAHDLPPSPQRGARLRQVYPTSDKLEEDRPGPGIDIIAIHGLDTNSEKTWTWRGNGHKVNWLADPNMLPSRVERVRIFTYDWPADLLQPSDLVQKTQDEFAILLFEEIRRRIQDDRARSRDRPIFFIASCLGGIILMKALVGAGQEYQSVRRATRGIVFLATPFRGTSFQDVAAFAEPSLHAWAWIRGRDVVKLLSIVKEPTLDLVRLVQDFTSLCQDKDHPCQVATFYEKGKTSLPSKMFPWLPAGLRQEKLLVDESSATLDMVPRPIPLSRPHVLMNKFAHSKCTAECKKGCVESEDFDLVSGKIVEMLQKIHEGSLLEQADSWIRTEHYNADMLKIERLSGNLLPLERCYINLAVIEKPRKTAWHTEEESQNHASSHTSPFSLTARLKVETPEKNIQVELPSLFNPRKGPNGQAEEPRRILIRGRAGVGKTTLCKKMISEFASRSEEFCKWNELFDRVLWVPLRKLKGWQASQYDLQELFCHEFFARKENRRTRTALAEELQRVVERGKTLFILDGLDEIAQELTSEGYKSKFLEILLNQSNAIITSRPHVSLPANVQPPDLELETVGFYPDQVKAYLQATFTDPKRVEDIQAYLQAYQLIQDLVRIPIQLDALCYTWDSFNGKAVPQTMTAIYRAIEESLWKKDILRLEKENGNKLVTKNDMEYAKRSRIEILVRNEVALLEGLAFIGMCNDAINFEAEHCEAIFEKFRLSDEWIPLNTTLPRLSFLRTSDPSEKDCRRGYHFLHLTFQEYFAARYFVRQWKAQKSLPGVGGYDKVKPATFLQDHKYDPRYNIFWRFVAGLLDADEEALDFFQEIEKEPHDLLGPTHQRLVMHCLSEVEHKVTTLTKHRIKLEKQLEQWILFECNLTKDCRFAREIECPEQVLVNVLKKVFEDAKPILLRSLASRAAIPSGIIDVVATWLDDGTSKYLSVAILQLLHQSRANLADETLQAIAARLEDTDRYVRRAAIEALQSRDNLADETLQDIAARLEDADRYVRQAAIEALQSRDNLADETLQAIAARLEDADGDVRQAAIEALQSRDNLADETLQDIAARLEDTYWYVRQAAIEALMSQTTISLVALNSYIEPLYKVLLEKSFYGHLYWYDSETAYIRFRLTQVSLFYDQRDKFQNYIQQIRENNNVPSLC